MSKEVDIEKPKSKAVAVIVIILIVSMITAGAVAIYFNKKINDAAELGTSAPAE